MNAYQKNKTNMDTRKFPVKIPIFGHSRNHNVYSSKFGVSTFPAQLLFVNDILDQGNTPYCTAYSACATRGSMKTKNYDPIAYWNEEAAYDGEPITENGTSPDTCMEVGVEVGWVPLGQPLPTDKAAMTISVIPNSGMDLFDSVRSALVETNNPIQGFVMWYADWDNTTDGIITPTFTSILGGHAIKIAGFTTVNNVPYIVIQNSWGSTVGINGLFYFDRATFNKAFGAGYVRLWSDSVNPTVQKMGLLVALMQNLLNLEAALGRAARSIINIFNK